MITFKSNNENFQKEMSGIKNNTFRKVDFDDERFLELGLMVKRGLEFGLIRIYCENNTDIYFDRRITDITFWEGYVIITWKHEVKNG